MRAAFGVGLGVSNQCSRGTASPWVLARLKPFENRVDAGERATGGANRRELAAEDGLLNRSTVAAEHRRNALRRDETQLSR